MYAYTGAHAANDDDDDDDDNTGSDDDANRKDDDDNDDDDDFCGKRSSTPGTVRAQPRGFAPPRRARPARS